MAFAAGIVPYIIKSNQVYFLLGMETSNNKWSGFVGGSEPGETIERTALREFHEETAMIFINQDEYISSQLRLTNPFVETTTSGKPVYIWFIKFPETLNDFSQFYNNKQLLSYQFNEKSALKWFTIEEVSSGNILYKLKKMIQLVFFKFKK